MSIPKQKSNLKIYNQKILSDRRNEMLGEITKSDVYFPDSILHDDLDGGMLDFVKKNLIVVSDGNQIPIIPKILTIQKWGEISSNWEYVDEDNNIKIPFIGVIRKPDVQPGTHPAVQRTIPDRMNFLYSTVKTWDGIHMGANVYKIPQPVAVDITYEITIVCHKFMDLNRFNKIFLQKFSSRQSYTQIKGHYMPITLENISDNSPIDTIDGRRYYSQTYTLMMCGLLIDSDEFEMTPAINRSLLVSEIVDSKPMKQIHITESIEYKTITIIADGNQTVFSTGEKIDELFVVSVNGLVQEKDNDFYFIGQTSKITFIIPPIVGDKVSITYYSGLSRDFINFSGLRLNIGSELFTYDGSTLTFTVNNNIVTILFIHINGLISNISLEYYKSGDNTITFLNSPVVGSIIGITYLYS